MMVFLMKIIAGFSILFFSYIFFLAMQERKKFFSSKEYETASLFEKIILNTVSIFSVLSFLLILVTYVIFILSSVNITPLF